ncbi:MAG: TetR/AcrR family transcriptional regulator [Burkholderiaceae bacterium]
MSQTDASSRTTPAAPPASTAPRGRDREQTAARILAAVGEVLSRDGFAGIGINAIAKQAGVDKVLIYRYYGGLPELLKAYGDSGAFWPSVADLLGDDPDAFHALPLPERYCRFMEHFIDALRARPLTLEILAQELVARNELTAILETEREEWGEQAARVLGGADFARLPGAAGVTVLLIAGVQYLLVRSRKIRTFGGFDLRSDAGWDALKDSVRAMVKQWFEAVNIR